MLAIVAYVICVGACIKVLLPHRLVFSFRGSVLMQAAREAAVDELEDALEAAMGWIESFIDSNRSQLDAPCTLVYGRLPRVGRGDRVVAARGPGYSRLTWAPRSSLHPPRRPRHPSHSYPKSRRPASVFPRSAAARLAIADRAARLAIADRAAYRRVPARRRVRMGRGGFEPPRDGS